MIKVDELRKTLVEQYNYTQEQVDNMKKGDLVRELQQARSVDLDFEAVEIEENNDNDNSKTMDKVEDRPLFGTREWSDFILAKLTEDEKVDGYPKLDGLRRLVENFVGTIAKSQTKEVQCTPNGIIILHEIEIENALTGNIETYSRVGESNEINTTGAFKAYVYACAESRAIGRVLRSILRVNTISYEEIAGTKEKPLEGFNNDDIDFNEPITATQIHFIDTLCKPPRGVDCNVAKFIKSKLGEVKLNKITREQAQELQQELSDFQSKGVPDELKGYVDGWQSSL